MVWLIYTEQGELVARGGLQREGDMTEPFVALVNEDQFWGRGISTAFLRQRLLPFYNQHTGGAPMRILTLPANKAAERIARSTELPFPYNFHFVRTKEEWGWTDRPVL